MLSFAVPVAAALVLAGCNGSGEDPAGPPPLPVATESSPRPTPTPADPSPTASAPTPAPTTPAPVGTPEAGAYKLAPTLPEADFTRMLWFEVIPGTNDAVIVAQAGAIWRVPLDGGGATLFGDVSDRLGNATGSEEGLLGLAFSPGFPADGRVYLSYTRGSPGPSVLARFQVVDGVLDAGSEVVLLEVPQPFVNHNGGQISFGADGFLYYGLGDGGSAGDPRDNGQDPTTLLGSILRLDVSGEGAVVPADNPFVGSGGARAEVYAYGLRNPWRFSFDRATGELWAGDVGQSRWEEVDRIVPGGNYGWNVVEGFECFESASCDTGDFVAPRVVYGHDVGCSVTGGYVYRGASMPELDGWYVYGDFCTGRVWAVDTADPPMADEPVLLANTGLAIASFGELPDGDLLALTFDNAIFQLVRSQ